MVTRPLLQLAARPGVMLPSPEDIATLLQFTLMTPRKKQLLDCMFDGSEESLEFLPGERVARSMVPFVSYAPFLIGYKL